MQPLIKASLAQSARAGQLAEEQFAWAKERYAEDKIVSKQVIDAALARQAEADKWAQEDRARYQSEFQPMEDALIKEAEEYNTPERREQEAGKAGATVAETFEANRRAAQQNLESFGVDPSSTRFAALDAGSRLAQAAAAAGAQNMARNQTEETARNLRAQAIQVGQAYPGQAIAELGTGIQSGNAGINSSIATTGSGASSMGTSPQYSQIAAGALGQAGDIMNNSYAQQMAQYNANQQQSSGIGSLLGTVAGAALPLIFSAEGGAIPEAVSPSGGQAVDDVPSMLTAGEFVIPKDVLSWKGEEFFQGLIDKSRKAQPQASAQPGISAIPASVAAQPPAFVSRPPMGVPPQAIPAGVQ
jgi:hypothetical protein